MSRVFFGGNDPIHWRTTCAQAYAGAIFCGRVLTRAFAGSLLSRNAFANALVFNFLKRELPHLHGHIFLFIGTSSFPFMGTSSPSMGTSSPSWPHIPLHWHIFLFIGTSSPSSAHLPLHWHIFPFIGTSSPSLAPLRLHRHIFPFMGTSSFQGHVEGGRWRDMVCFRESFREAFAGIREGP